MALAFSWSLAPVAGISSGASERYAASEQSAVDIRLAPNDWDIYVEQGDLVLTRGSDAIRQTLGIRLKFFQGEWFLDLDKVIGVPWLQNILRKQPSPMALASIWRNQILGSPGIKELTSARSQYNGITREAVFEFTATMDTGELLTGVGKADVPEGGV